MVKLLCFCLLLGVQGLSHAYAERFDADAQGQKHDQIHIIFCYENKELLPHFSAYSDRVPTTLPGAAIEILQALSSQSFEYKIGFIRYPWQRCLRELAEGTVDAIIGRFTPGRASFARFPLDSGGDLDESRSFSKTKACLLHHQSSSIFWDGEELEIPEYTSMSLPRGYQLVHDIRQMGFKVYEAKSTKVAYDLLFNGRVHSSLSDCSYERVPDDFVQNPKPIIVNDGYLMVSYHLYEKSGETVESLWNDLAKIDKNLYYSKYE